MDSLVVYAVVCGGFSGLEDAFPPGSDGFERVCFTDDLSIEPKGWRLLKLQDRYSDHQRESRRPKLLPHRYLPQFEWSLYVDTTVKFKMDPSRILDLHASRDMNFWSFRHPWRRCVFEEAEEVIRLGYDDERRVREQMDYYSRQGHPRNAGLSANGVLLRRHNDPAVIEHSELWFEHVLRFSKRDQLSFDFIARRLNLAHGFFEGELTGNQFILWPGYPRQSRIPADFDERTYEWLNPEVTGTGLSPREHYVLFGASKGLPYKTKTWELDRLANKYKTDKGSMYFNAHAYAAVYEAYVAEIKAQPIRLLELGMLRHDIQARKPDGPYDDAPSLFMWREYFTSEGAEIIGFDKADFSEVKLPQGCRIVRGDVGNPDDLVAVAGACQGGFDVIVDDASHASHHQQIALATLFPYLKSGGYYFVEDLCYQPPHLELPGATKTKTFLELLRDGSAPMSEFMTPEQVGFIAGNFAGIEFYDSFDRHFGLNPGALAVIRKR